MRVAMVLDNTGSMASDGKMPAMQTAAKSLIDQLSMLAKNPGDMYISVVPFAKDVNFGTSLRQPDLDGLGRSGPPVYQHWARAAAPSTQLRNPATTTTGPGRRTGRKWTGCVTDREQDYDTKNTIPTASNAPTMVVPEEYVSRLFTEYYCKTGSSSYLQPIVPLSYTWSTLKTSIHQHAAHRQYQPGHWSGVGLADARRGGAVQRTCEGYCELYL